MKVYGWDETGVPRGEMLAARVSPRELDFGLDMLAGSLGWEHAYPSFSGARRHLLTLMEAEGVDDELKRSVRALKASYLPVCELGKR